MSTKGPIGQHKEYAETGKAPQDGDTFGVAPFNATYKETQDKPRGWLKDHQRSIGKPRGFHPDPDHGPTD